MYEALRAQGENRCKKDWLRRCRILLSRGNVPPSEYCLRTNVPQHYVKYVLSTNALLHVLWQTIDASLHQSVCEACGSYLKNIAQKAVAQAMGGERWCFADGRALVVTQHGQVEGFVQMLGATLPKWILPSVQGIWEEMRGEQLVTESFNEDTSSQHLTDVLAFWSRRVCGFFHAFARGCL